MNDLSSPSHIAELPLDVWNQIFEGNFEDDDVTLWRLYKCCKAFKSLAWIHLTKRSKKLQEAASTFILNKKPSLAYQILSRALVFTPKNSTIYFARASCLQNFDSARWDCLKGMELEPYSHKGYFQLGYVYEKWSKITEAYICYKKAASIHSSPDIFNKVKDINRKLFSRVDTTYAPTLHEAIKVRSLRQIEDFLAKGLVNTVFPNSGFTPLAFACQQNHLEIVEYLLQKGASIRESEPAKVNAILTLLEVYTHKMKQQEYAQYLLKQSTSEKRGINEYDIMRQRNNDPDASRGVEGSNSDSSAHDELNNMVNTKCRMLLREWSNELIFSELVNNVNDKQFMQNNLPLFHKGIATGNNQIVNTQIQCLQYGLHPSHKAQFVKTVLMMNNHEGSTPLHEAIATNEPTLVQLLLDTIVFAANPQYSISTPQPSSEYIEAALNITNKQKLTPFLYACTVPKIKLEIISMLLKSHCTLTDPHNHNCFTLAALKGNYHILEALTDFDKNNVLNLQQRSEELAKIVDTDGNTILHHTLALASNKLNMILLPILKDVIDAHTAMNNDGMTPLMTGVSNLKSDRTVLQELIFAGSNLEFQNYEGNTALHLATLNFNFAAVGMLMKHGANADTQNRCGTTALCLACSGAVNESVAWLLLASGAQMIPNFRGITPLMMACEYGLRGLIDILAAWSRCECSRF